MLEFYGPNTIEFYLRKKQYNETLTETNKNKWPTKCLFQSQNYLQCKSFAETLGFDFRDLRIMELFGQIAEIIGFDFRDLRMMEFFGQIQLFDRIPNDTSS